MPIASPSVCSCTCCDGNEDGILYGPSRPVGHTLHATITEVFKHELFHKNIRPESVAVVSGPNSITFQELDHLSTAIALEIEKNLGSSFVVTNPEEELLIGVCLPTTERIVALMFAILKLGAAFLPLDPIYPEDLLLSIIHKFRPIMVITDDDGPILGKYDAKSFAEFCRLLSIEEIWMDMNLPPKDDPKWKTFDKKVELFSTPKNVEPNLRPAVVVHTTGIAGDPKGVRLGHKAVLNRCHWEWHQYAFSKKDACALTVAISSIDAIGLIFASLLKGTTLHIFKRNEVLNMPNLVHKFHEKGITRLYLYSHSIDSFLKAAKALGRNSVELRQLKLVCCLGDDLISTTLVHDFVNFFSHDVAIIKFYGPPEVGGNMIYHRFKSEKDADKKSFSRRILIDSVMQNCCLYILSNYLELTKDGVQGEICVAGDYGRIENVGDRRCLYIEGRFDNQVYYKGQHVLLEELEELILNNDKVEEVEMIIYDGLEVDKVIVGFVLPKEPHRFTLMAEDVRGALSNKIPEYLLPDIRIIEKVPIAGMNRKRVSQRQLVRIYEQERQSGFNNWGKLRFKDKELAACKLLLESMFKFAGIPIDKSANSLTSSFYELGGSSISLLSVLLSLNRSGSQLTLRDFLAAKNLNEIVDKMGQLLDAVKKPPLKETSGDAEPKPKTSNSAFYSINTNDLYETVILPKDSRREVVDMVSRAYFEKGALERYNLVHYKEYYDYFTEIWDGLVAAQLSIIVRRVSDGKIVGCSINQDYYTPTMDMTRYKSLHQVLEYSQELKGVVLSKVPHQKSVIFEIAWMATHKTLSPEDNVIIVTLMMKENIRLAKTDGFSCVFALATSRFFQELCLDVLGFDMLDEYPANNFKLTEGLHPFRVAPTIVTTCLCWLVIGELPTPTQSMNTSALDSLVRSESSTTSAIEYKQMAKIMAKGESLLSTNPKNEERKK
ncbi:unnamed protein product [Allacma fusca]|uniref:Carrier domain-containing protein n=1 Tax=Allacma fusca TaxID=39272 RepID=A0A8J2JSC2_9HEXA|nr:unnamed protein product [Allacma fusca]